MCLLSYTYLLTTYFIWQVISESTGQIVIQLLRRQLIGQVASRLDKLFVSSKPTMQLVLLSLIQSDCL
jgi:hypothetical protein